MSVCDDPLSSAFNDEVTFCDTIYIVHYLLLLSMVPFCGDLLRVFKMDTKLDLVYSNVKHRDVSIIVGSMDFASCYLFIWICDQLWELYKRAWKTLWIAGDDRATVHDGVAYAHLLVSESHIVGMALMLLLPGRMGNSTMIRSLSACTILPEVQGFLALQSFRQVALV